MKPFAQRYRGAVADPNVRAGLLTFQRAWRPVRDAQVAVLEAEQGRTFAELRDQLAATKDAVVADRRALLDAFRSAAALAGTVVVEVPDAAAANAYVVGLCRDRGIRLAVKSKSMVTEEIGANHALADAGITAIETDLGEWLIQLAHDHPSHLVLPVIHKRRGQIAELLTEVLGRPFDPDDIETMVHTVRTELRQAFLTAGLGISGANALVADTGSLLLVTNEGNAGLTTSLPRLHVALVGWEKLVPTTADAVDQIRLLARSATGQAITTYTTFVTGPTPGHELHVVVVDNGRSAMAADPVVDEALRCIRCGACADVCPPYQVVGGHAFGHVYTGAIGLVNTAFHHGLEAAAGPQSLCVSCGACATVCPVGIDLPGQILDIRRRVVEGDAPPEPGTPSLRSPAGRGRPLRRLGYRVFASRSAVGAATVAAAVVARPFRRGSTTQLPARLVGALGLDRHLGWRAPPAVPFVAARVRLAAVADARRRAVSSRGEAPVTTSGPAVELLLQCVTDRVLPDVAVAAAGLLEAEGCTVRVPGAQHCCGLPAFDGGDHDGARRMARATIDAFGGGGGGGAEVASAAAGATPVVTPAPSCAAMIRHEYPKLFAGDPVWRPRAEALAERTVDLVTFLAGRRGEGSGSDAGLADGRGGIAGEVASTADPAAAPAADATGPARPVDRLGAPRAARVGVGGVGAAPGRVTVHPFCQSRTVLGADGVLEDLVAAADGCRPTPLDEREVCCGFGGSTSFTAPEVAAGILERKLACIEATGADVVVTDNPGCVLHLRGGVAARGLDVEVRHVAEHLVGRLDPVVGVGTADPGVGDPGVGDPGVGASRAVGAVVDEVSAAVPEVPSADVDR